MQNLSDNIWIFDGEAVSFLGLPFTTRMTIVRLSNGDLWVHSPIKITEMMTQQLSDLGKVKYLIAPNHLHHLFLAEWILKYPDVICFGTKEVINKRNDITFYASLNKSQKYPWQDEIKQVLFTGSALMEECVFFHCASRVLIVTDLVENFNTNNFKPWQRFIAKAVGIVAPNGKMPLDWRLSFMFNKSEARQHLQTMLSWQPEVVVMAHGIIIEKETKIFLQRSFSWLL